MESMVEKGQVGRTRMSAEQRRESILNAAVEVFATTGYRAGKVSDVAAKVGVTEPVIFQNFGSKASLYAAVLDRAASDLRADLQDLMGNFGSASDLLAHVLNPTHAVGFSPAHDERPHAAQSYGVLFADAAALTAEPALTEAARRAVGSVTDHLADILRYGQSDGDIRADLDPEAAAWLLLAVLSTRRIRAAAAPDFEQLEDGVAALAIRALVESSPAVAHRHGQD